MTAYYNEFDPKAAAWLRSLIDAGLIAPGDVDTRSITEVQPDDLKKYTQCHFFAGIGGWSLALRRAMWPDTRPVWTGSCPCQPFSLAGKQKGFEDSRHLWPSFLRLISVGRPANLFGEQVASASAWLGLVRSDLEALGYAVGAMPIEAASAGADHLRDRYWFVADSQGERWDGRQGATGQAGRPRVEAGGMGDSGGTGLAQRSIAEVQRGDVRDQGAAVAASGIGGIPLAHTDKSGAGEEWEQRSGEQRWLGGDQETRDGGDVADALRDGSRVGPASGEGPQGEAVGIDGGVPGPGASSWVHGADGKIRRVKPGVRLLVDGFPCRVGLLRGFGNAIDPRPAAAFIKAADEAMTEQF